MYFFQEKILVITRPKKSGPGTHWGVYFPDGRVVDYTNDQGLRITTPGGFADGHDVNIMRVVPLEKTKMVRERLELILLNLRTYDVFAWNCETFATWLAEGNAKSEQARGAVMLAAIAMMAAAGS